MTEKEEEKKEEKTVDIKDAAAGLMVGGLPFSEIFTDKSTGLPAFSSLSVEALEDLAPFTDFQPSSAVDMAVIESNKTNKELSSNVPDGQSVTEKVGDAKFRQRDLFEKQSAGFPSEMDTEELPSNPGGATPRASTGVSNLRGSTDIRTKGNPYGYA